MSCSLCLQLECYYYACCCLQSYCEKHSRQKKNNEDSEGEATAITSYVPSCPGGSSPRTFPDLSPSSTRKKKDLTSEQRNQARAAKLRQIETEFFKYVDTTKTSNYLDIDFETTEAIFYYWKLKRRVSHPINVTYTFYCLVICVDLRSPFNPFGPELMSGMPKISIKVSDAIWHHWNRKG